MCEFCGTEEEKKSARFNADFTANQLSELSWRYALLAQGKLKPHTDDMEPIKLLARCIIKELIGWL